jgi:hypothetical protein
VRHVLTAACLAAMPLIGGCGLVFVPTVHEYPGAVKAVRVIDDESGEALAGADVRFEVCKYANWCPFPPVVVEASEEVYAPGMKSEEKVRLAATRTGDVFHLERRYFWGLMQIWLPLPPILGPALLHEHRGLIYASAENYQGLVFSYNPRNAPMAGEGYEFHSREGHRVAVQFDEQGVLTFRLCRTRPPAP